MPSGGQRAQGGYIDRLRNILYGDSNEVEIETATRDEVGTAPSPDPQRKRGIHRKLYPIIRLAIACRDQQHLAIAINNLDFSMDRRAIAYAARYREYLLCRRGG